MPVTFQIQAILDRIEERIHTLHGVALGLVIVQVGDLSPLLAGEDVRAYLPGVFVVPSTTTLQTHAIGLQTYRYQHDIRVLYVDKFTPGAEVQRGFFDRLETIAEGISNDPALNNLDLGGDAMLMRAYTRSVEWIAPEQAELARAGRLDVLVGAFTVEAHVQTTK